MKTINTHWIILFLFCTCMCACLEPIEFDWEDYPGNYSRAVGPEGRFIQFFDDYFFADDPDDPSTVLVELDIPPLALGDTIFTYIIKGDNFSVYDLFPAEEPTYDTIIHPMFTGAIDSVLWQWRAMVGFLPNLQVLSRTAQLSFAFEEPRINVYPNKNMPGLLHFFHYYEPSLYRLVIDADINPFMDSARVVEYVMMHKASWEEVESYDIDYDEQRVRLEIDNFYYLYFLAGKRWTLQKDDHLTLSLSNTFQGNLDIDNQELVEEIQAGKTNNEAFNDFLSESDRGFMYVNDRSTYRYFGPFSGDLAGPFGPNINRIGLRLVFDGETAGSYSGLQTSVRLYWALETDLAINLIDIYESRPELGMEVQIDSYGEVGELIKGRLTGSLKSQSFGSREIEIDMPFELMRTK